MSPVVMGADLRGVAGNKDVRRLCAATLVLEAVVIGLAIPVAIKISGADPAAAGIAGGGVAVLCLVLCGLLRHRWAFYAGTLVQLAAIASGAFVSLMYVLGVIFALLWVWGIIMPLRYEARVAATADGDVPTDDQANHPNHTS